MLHIFAVGVFAHIYIAPIRDFDVQQFGLQRDDVTCNPSIIATSLLIDDMQKTQQKSKALTLLYIKLK